MYLILSKSDYNTFNKGNRILISFTEFFKWKKTNFFLPSFANNAANFQANESPFLQPLEDGNL